MQISISTKGNGNLGPGGTYISGGWGGGLDLTSSLEAKFGQGLAKFTK